MGKKLLLVDDEENVVHALERIFVPAGHQVFSASGGEAALALLADEKIDLVDIGVLVHGKDIISGLHKLLVPTDEYLQYASFRDVRVANSLWPERAATEPKMPGI